MEKHLLNTKSLRMVFFLSLFLSSFVNSYSQTYEYYVGEVRNLPEPTPPIGSFVAITDVSTNKEGYIQTSGSLKIYVYKYFSGTATVSVSYKYSYWSSKTNRMEPGDATAYYSIKCKPTTIKLKETEVEVGVGGDVKLEYETIPSGLEPIINWTSSNNNIATVTNAGKNDIEGVITGITEGTCIVTADGNTGVTAPKCTVNVVDYWWIKSDTPSGLVTSGTKVTLTSKKAGATIYYTTDNTEPTKNSQRYIDPIVIDRDLTLKAKAYLGNKESKTDSWRYQISSHSEGDIFKAKTIEGVDVSYVVHVNSSFGYSYLTVGSGNSSIPAIEKNYSGNVTIPSKVDGIEVSKIDSYAFAGCQLSSVTFANSNVTIPSLFTIQASAFKDCKNIKKIIFPSNLNMSIDREAFSGCENLENLEFHSDRINKIETKAFYGCNSINSVLCSMTHYYPNIAYDAFTSTTYDNAVLYVPQGYIDKYKAKRGWESFKNIREIGSNPTPKLELSASPSGGSVESGTKVYLTAKADGSTVSSADIYYTTNGTPPSKSSNKYTSSGISITQACTLKAIAYKDGYDTSEVGSWNFTITSKPKLTLSASPSGGSVESGTKVYLTAKADGSTVSGADIYYTTNNTEPTKNSYRYTSSGITINESCTLKAIAYMEGYDPSDVLTEIYSVHQSEGKSTVISVSAGLYHSLVLMSDGTLWGCGLNYQGELAGIPSNNKKLVKFMEDVASVSAGEWFTLILKKDGTLWSCGYNSSGQLGDGTTTNRSAPVYIMKDVASVSAGCNHSLILKTDGTLWACGRNNYGQLGDGTTSNRAVPVKIMDNVYSATGGLDHTLILKKDESLWACGANSYGGLGDGTTNRRTTPVKIMDGVATAAAGADYSLIIKKDASLWVCGDNSDGQLGDGTYTSKVSFVKLMDDVASASAGYDVSSGHILIIKKDGNLWTCGNNSYGQLGDGTTTNRTTPVLIMNDVVSTAAGLDFSLFVKKDGSVWSCGKNNNGQLGDGTTTNRNTPVRLTFYEDVGETASKLELSASPSGGSVESGTKVYLTAKADGSTVSSADIYYTTNGTSPSKSSNKYTSSGISITQACTLKAIAYKDGYETSEVESWSYTIKSSTVEPTSISVSPSTKTIEVGETFTPTYSLTPSNASTTVTWSSDDSSIASVDSNTGLVTGQKAGSTYINATTVNGKTSWCKVTVTSATPSTTANEITVKTSNAGYATFYSAGFAYTLPNGLSAQVVTNASDNKLTYKSIADGSVSGVIPAGTAVMLVSDNKQAGTYTLTSTESKASYSGTNLLRGNDAATTTTGDGYHYKLSYGQPGSNLNNVFGWYWGAQNGAPFQIEGHKAWLVVPKSSASTRGFAIGGEATGIEMISGDDVEEADAVYYDLQGRRVTKPTVKGVYIKNGKKVMVK